MSPAAIPARACAKGESYQTSAASTNDRIDFCAGPRLVDAQVIIRVRVGRAERGRDARKGLVPREDSRVPWPLHFQKEKSERRRRRRARALRQMAVGAGQARRALAFLLAREALLVRIPDTRVVEIVDLANARVGERRPCRWVPRTARIEHAAARGHVGRGSLYRAFEYAIHINAKQGVDVCDPDVVGLASFEEGGARNMRAPV